MSALTRAVILALLCSPLPSCQGDKDSDYGYYSDRRPLKQQVAEQLAEGEQRRPPAVNSPAAHVVIVWLKKPGDAAARDAIVRSAEPLRSIPGVVDVRAGGVIPSTRDVVDSTYDVGILVTFRDEAAMRAYAAHPAHQKVVEEVIRPHVERYRVYDFRIGK